jgi:hypothetical protein
MHFRYSLAQLFLGLTVWSLCLGAIVAFFDTWAYALLAVGAVIAIIVVFAKVQSLVGVVFLSLPIVCFLNWSSFVIALDHAFGGRGIVASLLEPIADFVSWPVVAIQNGVPLTRPWDTLFGIATISMAETFALILLIKFCRICTRRKTSAA